MKERTWNLAVAPAPSGDTLMVHQADCPDVRLLAEAGEPVMTMIACEKLPTGYPFHECMKDERGG